jgi:hypothetical protein
LYFILIFTIANKISIKQKIVETTTNNAPLKESNVCSKNRSGIFISPLTGAGRKTRG